MSAVADPRPEEVLPPATMASVMRHYRSLMLRMGPDEAFEHAVVTAYHGLSRAASRSGVVVDMTTARKRLRG